MRVFLAAPFTAFLESVGSVPSTRRVKTELTRLLTELESLLLSEGHEVFLAHRREDFGASLWPAETCTPFDFLEIQRSDVVIAIPGSSYGVHIELGWASALGKPIIMLVDAAGDQPHTPLACGLHTVVDCRVLHWEFPLTRPVENLTPIFNEIVRQLHELGGRDTRKVPSTRRIAFLSTSFGFGPISKALQIANEVKSRAGHVQIDLFASGIDFDFAHKSQVFDRIYRIDVDSHKYLPELIPILETYSAVISVLNTDVLPLWTRKRPLFFVDSLAWMWPTPLPGISNAERYFVQDYLFPFEHPAPDSLANNIRQIAPICSVRKQRSRSGEPEASSNGEAFRRRLVVNFSGCQNPLVESDVYERYAIVQSRFILSAAKDFDDVVICCNGRLAEVLRISLPGDDRVTVSHLPHDEFLSVMQSADTLLTSPGITTTLEAIELGVTIRFLLPQNYSQSLLNEMYREQLGDSYALAFSRFGNEFKVRGQLPESDGIRLTVEYLETILKTKTCELERMIEELVLTDKNDAVEHLRANVSQHWTAGGQEAVASEVLASIGVLTSL